MKDMPFITNAFLLIENGRIADYGSMTECPIVDTQYIQDLSGRIVLPCWCDSHTHLVYARSRAGEFVDRIKGLTYAQIAERGGGILNSARRLQDMSETQLYENAAIRLKALIEMGTGAIEIKSGYGLTIKDERKMLSVIQRLKQSFDIPIRATLLAAHALPKAYHTNRDGYIDLIVNEMIPQFATDGLMQFIDVFCETGYFTVAEMERILKAGVLHGLIPKVHVNQFTAIGGVAAAIKTSGFNCRSSGSTY